MNALRILIHVCFTVPALLFAVLGLLIGEPPIIVVGLIVLLLAVAIGGSLGRRVAERRRSDELGRSVARAVAAERYSSACANHTNRPQGIVR